MTKVLAPVGLSILCLMSAGCKVQQTKDAKLPEVHATGGQLPAYDVKGPDVKVSSKPETVKVPVVKVKTP